ncbi:MAG: 1-acyl-sn-glycerol-3-phosphate acyltransferase [Gemmatimonadales bacterium]|nr:1-acyl-sn-glycerol-3-phosphate acyltransferase [Gemmatimonadales bacterium]
MKHLLYAVRYLVATAVFTTYYSARIMLALILRVKPEPGGVYDRIQQSYGRAMLASTGMSVRVEGLEHVAPGQPVVYISNHQSWVDIWALLAVLPGVLRFVFKKELSRVPLLGWAINTLGHVSIDRGNRGSAFASYDSAAEQIRGGVSAIVFAEGTRSSTGSLQSFKKGPFVLAISAQVPVVPVYCETYQRLPKGSLAPRPGIVRVRLGSPIATNGLDYAERDGLADRTREALLRLGAQP